MCIVQTIVKNRINSQIIFRFSMIWIVGIPVKYFDLILEVLLWPTLCVYVNKVLIKGCRRL